MMKIRTLALTALVAFASFGAAAQTTLYFREGQRVDPQEVKQILENGRPEIATRSIRLLADDAAAGGGSSSTVVAAASVATVAATAAAQAGPSALSLPVQFEFDSAKISPAARTQLDALAEGIKLLAPGRSVTIEGHTDARGSDFYNDVLSMRRAAAVKAYLVAAHGIDPQRLTATGYGKQQPIAGTDPAAPENRRVQFRGG
jgi:outer membrane protein OmpA-like peptidoglycan-associated protein